MFIIYIKHYFPHISIKFFVQFCYWYHIWVITQLCSRACLGVLSMKILSNFFPKEYDSMDSPFHVMTGYL